MKCKNQSYSHFTSISVTCGWDILQFNLKKSLDLDLKILGLRYRVQSSDTTGLGLEKCPDYPAGGRLDVW